MKTFATACLPQLLVNKIPFLFCKGYSSGAQVQLYQGGEWKHQYILDQCGKSQFYLNISSFVLLAYVSILLPIILSYAVELEEKIYEVYGCCIK